MGLLEDLSEVLAEKDTLRAEVERLALQNERLQKLLCKCPDCFYGRRCKDAEAAYRSLTETPIGEGPTSRPCCVEAYNRGFTMGQANPQQTLIEKRADPSPTCDHALRLGKPGGLGVCHKCGDVYSL